MNLQELFQLQQLQKPMQKPQPYNPDNPYDLANAQNLMAQVGQMRQQMLPPEPKGMIPFLANMIGDMGTMGLRESETPSARNLGKILSTSGERRAMQEASLPKSVDILSYLERAHKRNESKKLKERELEEHERHNKATENIQSSAVKDSIASGRKLNANQRIWNSYPVNAKNDMIAKAVGMGYEVDDAVRAFTSGLSLKDLADQKDLDLGTVEKAYAPTTANITKIKNQEGNAAEIDYLAEVTTQPMAKYSSRIAGVSPRLVLDTVFNGDKDELAKYYAARALQPEIAAARINLASGSNAFGSIHEVQEKTTGTLNDLDIKDPEVYEKTQHYINEWLKEGFGMRKAVISNVKPKKSSAISLEQRRDQILKLLSENTDE